jgi:hypothetical protein
MSISTSAVLALLLALEPARGEVSSPTPPAEDDESDISSLEPNRGAGASPVELIPRLEIRQSFVAVGHGVSLHDTTTEIDIQFLDRVLLRYEGTLRVLAMPSSQTSGFGDARIQAITILASSRRYVAGLLTGAVLDTASRPELGAGKQQVFFGAGGAAKPFRWWLPYLVVEEQISVGGDAKRPDVNQLTVDAGSIVFGKGQTWYKLDAEPIVDFNAGAARLFGELEVGRLLFRKVGLFMRTGTQLAGARQVDYSFEVGARYLFRLGD